MKNQTAKYFERYTELNRQAQSWQDDWLRIRDYQLPKHGNFTGRGERPNQGDSRGDKRIDATASHSIRTLAAGMQGGLTSPSRPWFRLKLQDRDLADRAPVKQWLHQVEQRLYTAFSSSNFYQAIHTVYAELGGFGTAVLYALEDPHTSVRFVPLTAGEYRLATSYRDTVDCIYRIMHRTARQLVQRFGNKCSNRVQQAADKTPHKYFKVLHVVQPRESYDPRKRDNRNMPYESVYLELDNERTLLSVSGFEEMPGMAVRWQVVGSDVYGRGPGHDALPNVMMLQEVVKSEVHAIHLGLRPPLRVPTGFKGRLNLTPSGFNYIDPTVPQQALSPILAVQPNAVVSADLVRRLQEAVRKDFYNDMFLMMVERPGMTATEVMERNQEKLIMLGPVIERMHAELLDPLISRVYNIQYRQGLIPPPPAELEGMDYKIEYISLLAQAQHMVGRQSINEIMNFAAQYASVYPELLDKVDADQALDEYGEAVGVSPRVLRPTEEAVRIRQQRAAAQQEQQQAMAQQQELAQTVQAAKTLSDTSVKDGNALSELLGGMNGQ